VRLRNGTDRDVSATAPWTLRAGGATHEASSACNVALRNGLSSTVEVDGGGEVRGPVCFDVPTSVTGGVLGFSPRLGGAPVVTTRL